LDCDTLNKIVKYLDVVDLLAMSRVNKNLNRLCNDIKIWKTLYEIDFNDG
jgi:hypothetical protein